MGLDANLYAIKQHEYTDTDFEMPEREEIAGWRNQYDLHKYMAAIYRAKGGKQEDFNCTTVRLSRENLQDLKAIISAGIAIETIEAALEAEAGGAAIYYWAWY